VDSSRVGCIVTFLRYPDLSESRLTKSFKEFRTKIAALQSPAGRVFVSHSSRDESLLPAVFTLLEDEFGAALYVDVRDARLSQATASAAAPVLRAEIAASLRFVVLATEESQLSGWIPWELGVADAAIGRPRIAILPMTRDGRERSWAGREYFGIYPRVHKRSGVWRVHDPYDEKYWPLDTWLEPAHQPELDW